MKRSKQRKESRRKSNSKKKEDSLKVVGHLSVWYVQVLALHPTDHREAKEKLMEWQRLMMKEDPEDRLKLRYNQRKRKEFVNKHLGSDAKNSEADKDDEGVPSAMDSNIPPNNAAI